LNQEESSPQTADLRELAYSNYVTSHLRPPGNKVYDSKITWFPVLAHVPANRNSKILDLGCGDGSLVEKLSTQGYSNVMGIDTSTEQINIAISRGLGGVEVADALDFLRKGGANQWDVILMVDVLEHFSTDEGLVLFEAVQFALSPGGTVIAQTPNSSSPFFGHYAYGDLTHRSVYNERSVKQLSHLVGLQPVAVHEVSVAPKGGISRGLRRMAFRVVKKIYQFALSAENGPQMDAIVTQNLILVAKKNQRRQ